MFYNKIMHEGGFTLRTKEGKGALDKSKHIVIRVLLEKEWPEGVAARAEEERRDVENNKLPLNSNFGIGPIVGPGIPNRGDFFAIIDGEHQWHVFPKQ